MFCSELLGGSAEMQRLGPLAARTVESDGSGLEEELLILRLLGHGARSRLSSQNVYLLW